MILKINNRVPLSQIMNFKRPLSLKKHLNKPLKWTQAPPDAQQAPQAETQAPSDNVQQVPQTETQAPSNAQEDEQVNYDVYNSYIYPYTMQDDYGPHLYKYDVTKWLSFKENNS